MMWGVTENKMDLFQSQFQEELQVLRFMWKIYPSRPFTRTTKRGQRGVLDRET